MKLQLRDHLMGVMSQDLHLLRETAKSMTTTELGDRKSVAISTFEELKAVQGALLNNCTRQIEMTALLEVRDTCAKLHLDILKEIEVATAASKANQMTTPTFGDIRLQKFSGTATEWVEWRANFEEKVLHTTLTAAQKIDLLLDSLTGDAKESAGKAESRNEEELQRIWGKLVHWYNNPYKQVFKHFLTILTLDNIDSPSAKSFRTMVNVVEEQLRLLSKYKVGISELLSVILLLKLDDESRYLWNTAPTKPIIPNTESLFNFLRERSRALEDEQDTKIASSSLSQSLKVKPVQSEMFKSNPPYVHNNNRVVNRNGRKDELMPYTRHPQGNQSYIRSCALCGKNHNLIGCYSFADMTVKQKNDFVINNKICSQCLKGRHSVNDCRSRDNCKTCSSPTHNTVLCADTPRQVN